MQGAEDMKKEEVIADAVRVVEQYRAQGYTCAESSIRTLADVFACPLPEDIVQAASVFSGGAAVDGRCGVCESALIFVAYLFGGKKSAGRLGDCARRVGRDMTDALGSVMCSDLFYPLYEEHRATGEPEEDFHCVFDSGIACVAGTICDLLYASQGETFKVFV
jgi:C_GCAxxG_C_C family probable redox protein